MMKFVSKMTEEYGVKTLVSLNAIMVDGTGMCGCCRVTWAARPSSPAWTGRNLTVTRWISTNCRSGLQAYKEEEAARSRSLQKKSCTCGR